MHCYLGYIEQKYFLRQSIFGTPISGIRQKKGLSKSVSKYELCGKQWIHTSKILVTLTLTLMFCCQQGGTWLFIQDTHLALSPLPHLPQRVCEQVRLGCEVDF